jgi:AmmeMemoRadiSam system protein A
MSDKLTVDEKQTLLRLAREALASAVRGEKLAPLDLAHYSPRLASAGAAFVTLTVNGQLRGCVGSLRPSQPLAEDVRENAISAGLYDHRFRAVRASELAGIRVEVSRLTLPRPLAYTDAQDLLAKLRPGVDGVILRDGSYRATFLPQVWEQIPEKTEFLGRLCEKMGASSQLWRQKHLDVEIYQVEEFHE